VAAKIFWPFAIVPLQIWLCGLPGSCEGRKQALPRRKEMKRHTLGYTLPATLLCMALAAPGLAQNALTETAPGQDAAPAGDATGTAADPVATEQSFGATDMTATDIIRELAPVEGNMPAAPRVVQTPNGIVTMDSAHAIDLTVFFAYDSDRLLPEARGQLDALGQALNDPALLPFGFLIAGHTDARGPANYNLDLSIRRALSVASYLVRYHNISPDRLVAHGWGEAELKLPSDPMSGANRRVEVSLLLPQQSGYYQPDTRLPVQIEHGIEHSYVVVTDHVDQWGWPSAHAFGLTDPRWRLWSGSLDDFNATPTWPTH
jgi:OmpA-OmpF porin, OOP family